MVANGFDVPAMHVSRVRLKYMPCFTDEADQRAAALAAGLCLLDLSLEFAFRFTASPFRPYLLQRRQRE